MRAIGVMEMPANFRYRDVFLKGRPQHDRYDPFRIRHPGMERRKRAKIFAPFDALKGFGEAVAAKDVLYENKVVPGQEQLDELNRRLGILRGFTCNSRLAGDNHVQVTVTYYEPCRDENHEAYGRCGRYRTITGICRKVDAQVTETILIDETRIPLRDVLRIDSAGTKDIFRREVRYDKE